MADGFSPPARLGVRVRGVVQGVGFRPHVHRLAKALNLSGLVRNDGEGVWIEVEGPQAKAFVTRLQAEAPPLARIESVVVELLQAEGGAAFTIEASAKNASTAARIPADAGICAACVDELFDPANRRYLYPFIACCDCGPRFTMTRALPYDRPQTSMADFPLCEACEVEYTSPASRRFHAEPTCCAACGPRYDASPTAIVQRLAAGDVLAVKGVGGFHIMADARNASAIAKLRAKKERGGKPFAVLVANLASARQWAEISEEEATLLQSPARPIVLCKARGDLGAIAPGLDTIGLMLPATPLHWLLFHEAAGRPTGAAWRDEAQTAAFICTSANRGGEPLVIDADAAQARLGEVVDSIVDHDRGIVVRVDDPVLRMIAGAPVVLRRGRGQTPDPIRLPREIPPTIAFGGHLKAAVCVTRGSEAFLAQHVGDLDDPDTIQFYRETIARLTSLLNVKPVQAACDLHPDFISTRFAEECGLPLTRVQHHGAHAGACAAENGLTADYLALALDGYGYGDGGEAWGGELLLMRGARSERLGGLKPLPLPGGDRAAREPWRMAAAALHAVGRGAEIGRRFANQAQAPALAALMARGAPTTSSCGRVFDAAAGLLGVCDLQTYEAEAAMRLEAIAARGRAFTQALALDGLEFDPAPLLAQLADASPEDGAATLHASLARGLAVIALRAAESHGLRDIVLTGGCLANRLLAEHLGAALQAGGIRAHFHKQSPPGDGGLALGQAWLAGGWEDQSCV
jgi:hydrogenase maturation protein HypF